MKIKSTIALRSFLLASGSSLIAIPSASAASGTWNSDVTNSLWSLNTNWLSNTIADGSGFTANFTNDITGDRTVNLDSVRTLTSLVFGDSNTATAGSWTVGTSNLTLAGTTPGITVNALGTGKTATISSLLQGTAGLVKSGAGTLILSNNSGGQISAGEIFVSEGVLELAGNADFEFFGFGNALRIASGATLTTRRNNSFGANPAGAWTIAGTITGTQRAQSMPSSVTLNNGTMSGNSFAAWGTFLVNAGTTITANGATNTISAGDIGMLNTLNLNTPLTGDVLAISSRLGQTSTNAGGLTKSGLGTVTLSSSLSTYTGATNVNAGTLTINGTGTINSSSAINVAAGGTLRYNSSTALNKVTLNGTGTGSGQRAVLGGTGPIGASITLDNTGDVLSPGNSPGIQNYTVGQTWASFSYDWEVNNFTGTTAGTDFDQITGTTFTLGGGPGSYILNVLGLDALNAPGLTPNFSEMDRTWTILTGSGASTFNAANWTINTAGFSSPDAGTWALAQAGNTLVLSYTAIPEPTAAFLGGLGLLALLRRRR